MINGKKTYILAGALAVLAVYETLTGDLTVRQAIAEGRGIELLGAGVVASLRHGMPKK